MKKNLWAALICRDMETTADAGVLDFEVKEHSTELLLALVSGLTCSKL